MRNGFWWESVLEPVPSLKTDFPCFIFLMLPKKTYYSSLTSSIWYQAYTHSGMLLYMKASSFKKRFGKKNGGVLSCIDMLQSVTVYINKNLIGVRIEPCGTPSGDSIWLLSDEKQMEADCKQKKMLLFLSETRKKRLTLTRLVPRGLLVMWIKVKINMSAAQTPMLFLLQNLMFLFHGTFAQTR